MDNLEKYNNGDGTFTSPKNGKTYKSLKAFRAHWNYNSDKFKKAKIIQQNIVECNFCNKPVYISGIKQHEKNCYLNLLNLKLCVVCNNPIKDFKRSKGTCSYSCANKHWAHIKNKDDTLGYQSLCFRYHKKECIVCGEDKIVAVHHNDHNHNNNDIENLIPMCPTHHQYVHSKYVNEVQPIIDEYIKKWKNRV